MCITLRLYSILRIKKESGVLTTHFDYHSIEGRMTKLDILGHDDPTIIRMLEDLTGIDAKTIPFDDPRTLSLFSSTEGIGLTPEQLQGDQVASLAVPECGTKFVRGTCLKTLVLKHSLTWFVSLVSLMVQTYGSIMRKTSLKMVLVN